MKYTKDNKKIKIAILSVLALIVGMSVGYAAFSSVLKITGIGHVKGVRWSIHYVEDSINVLSDNMDNITNITGEDVIRPAAINEDLNTISFELNIKPNTKYEFNVDIINDGDYDGLIKSILLTTTKGTNSPINEYSNSWTDGLVIYNVYYEDGSPIEIADELKTGETKTLKFKVQYIPVGELASQDDIEYKFEASIEYTQSSGLSKDEEADVPYKITYIKNGGTMSATNKYVNRGDSIGTLPTPTYGELSFQGWYLDEALTQRVEETYIPTSNINLYAKFGGKHVITIVAENAKENSVDKIYVAYGDAIKNFPVIDYKTCFKHEGWYLDKELTQKIETTYHPTEDMTIYTKSMLISDANKYFLLDGYKFKTTTNDNILITNSNIGTGTWQQADSQAKSFMPKYNSKLFEKARFNNSTNLGNGTQWWLEDKYGNDDSIHYYITGSGEAFYYGTLGTVDCFKTNTSILGIRPIIDVTKVSFKSTGGIGTEGDPCKIEEINKNIEG